MWMSHVTYEWVMSHINESCHMWMRYNTQVRGEESEDLIGVLAGVMLYMNESCHTGASHLIRVYESFHTYAWVMSRMCELCQTGTGRGEWRADRGAFCAIILYSPLSLYLSHSHTYTYTRTNTHMHAHTHTYSLSFSLSLTHTHTHTSTHTRTHRYGEGGGKELIEVLLWVIFYLNDSCHIWMSHVTYEWAVSHRYGEREARS